MNCDSLKKNFPREEPRYSIGDVTHIEPARKLMNVAEFLCTENVVEFNKIPSGLDLVSLVNCLNKYQFECLRDYLNTFNATEVSVENLTAFQFSLHDLNIIRMLSLADLSVRGKRQVTEE